jgi:hypothetical protein
MNERDGHPEENELIYCEFKQDPAKYTELYKYHISVRELKCVISKPVFQKVGDKPEISVLLKIVRFSYCFEIIAK